MKRTSAHPSVKALRASFASLRPSRVTAGRAPVHWQLWPEGELPAVAADRIFDINRSASRRSRYQPDRTDHLLRKAVILTCYQQGPREILSMPCRGYLIQRRGVSVSGLARSMPGRGHLLPEPETPRAGTQTLRAGEGTLGAGVPLLHVYTRTPGAAARTLGAAVGVPRVSRLDTPCFGDWHFVQRRRHSVRPRRCTKCPTCCTGVASASRGVCAAARSDSAPARTASSPG